MPKKPTLINLDPATLKVHPNNVRRDLGDLRPMVRSVRERGVLVPLLVVPDGDDHMVIFGHRRQQAAIQAERDEVPCIVRHDLEGDAEQIAAMVIENIHRAPLTAGEEAAAYEQLAGFGLSDTAIARQTGTTRNHVAKARKVAASDVASTAADRYDLTLDQALVLAEFEDDAQAVRDLTVTAKKNPGQFPHVASRLRQDREAAAVHATAVAALTDAGVTVVDRDALRRCETATSLRDLTDSDDGTPIDPGDHLACPGHVAFVAEHRPDDPDFYCLDPDGNGHRNRYQRSGRPAATPMTDEAKAERKEVIDNNKAWRAAEPVRREFVRALLARKTAPKGTLRFAAVEVLTDPEAVGRGGEDLMADLLGTSAGTGWRRHAGLSQAAKASEAQLPLVLLAQVAADREQGMGVHTWRNRDVRAARWLGFLAGVGYSLSDIEQQVIDAAPSEEEDEEPATDEEEPAVGNAA
jgi:ParB family chromosome partitioning protein